MHHLFGWGTFDFLYRQSQRSLLRCQWNTCKHQQRKPLLYNWVDILTNPWRILSFISWLTMKQTNYWHYWKHVLLIRNAGYTWTCSYSGTEIVQLRHVKVNSSLTNFLVYWAYSTNQQEAALGFVYIACDQSITTHPGTDCTCKYRINILRHSKNCSQLPNNLIESKKWMSLTIVVEALINWMASYIRLIKTALYVTWIIQTFFKNKGQSQFGLHLFYVRFQI